MTPAAGPEHAAHVAQHGDALVTRGRGELAMRAVNHHQVERVVVERQVIERTDAHLHEHAHLPGAPLHLHRLGVVRHHVRRRAAEAGFRREQPRQHGVVHADLQQAFAEFDARHRHRERIDVEPAE